MKIIAAMLMLALLAGCMNIDFDPSKSSDISWVDKNESWKIAIDYYHMRTRSDTRLYTMPAGFAWSYGRIDPRVLEHYEQALVLKGLNQEHVPLIRKGEICSGMPEFAINAAWGFPREVNTDKYSWGTSKQFVFGYYGQINENARKYAYTKNGTITSFSLR